MQGILTFALLTFLTCLYASYGMKPDEPIMSKYYCVIGAGPAGLQMGYYLERSGRDYIIFEKSNQSGNFFARYPRHRKLISINKRNTGRTNKEFNMRHDWNSLLSDDESLLLGEYHKGYFPPADILLDYLRDYQRKLGLKVQFDTQIRDIMYRSGECRYSMRDQYNNLYCCKNVVIGTGWSKSKVPSHVPGVEYLDSYDTISINPEDFEGKSVLIFGMGNSAFETAMAIFGRANVVHIAGRRRIRLSWETHYVGDIRGLNNEILDNYMLKSLDGILEIDINEIKFTKRPDGKIQLIASGSSTDHLVDKNPVRDGYHNVILCLGFEWDSTIFHKSMKVGSSTLPKVPKNKFPDIGYDYQSTRYPGLFFAGTISHSVDFRKSAGGFIHGFRYTVRALHRYLEWQNFNVKWPAVTASIEHLPAMLLKRANEASGIYQMFSHLGDLAIYDRETNRFTYMEEFPLSLLPYLYDYTGRELTPSKHSAIVLVLEYGRNFSKPGVDHFSEDRAQGSVPNAHLSNFLHPVIYYYNGRLPTGQRTNETSSDK